MWRIKTTKDGVWLGSWILHSATQFHPFSTLPWDDQYPLHHRAIDQSLREGKNSGRSDSRLVQISSRNFHYQRPPSIPTGAPTGSPAADCPGCGGATWPGQMSGHLTKLTNTQGASCLL